MITWLQIWPLLLMPTVILSAIAAFPTSLIGGRVLGGGPVREYYLNHFLLPVLPADASASLVSWFSTASSMQEWLLACAVSVNLNAILLPLLYVTHRTWAPRFESDQLKGDCKYWRGCLSHCRLKTALTLDFITTTTTSYHGLQL